MQSGHNNRSKTRWHTFTRPLLQGCESCDSGVMALCALFSFIRLSRPLHKESDPTQNHAALQFRGAPPQLQIRTYSSQRCFCNVAPSRSWNQVTNTLFRSFLAKSSHPSARKCAWGKVAPEHVPRLYLASSPRICFSRIRRLSPPPAERCWMWRQPLHQKSIGSDPFQT